MQACLSILRILSATFNRNYVENGALMYAGDIMNVGAVNGRA